MKIVHITANAPYNDYWGYQDNLLPKYHKKFGHDVTMITTNTMQRDGKIVKISCDDYYLDDGVRVIRLEKKKYFSRIITNLNSKLEVYKLLVEIKPDFVFFHGLVSLTIMDVVRYKNKINPNCVIVQDNHLDYNIGSKCKSLKEKIYREYYRLINKFSQSHVSKVYGVTPWRKLYAEDYFKISKEKTDVLIMGADDDQIDFENKNVIRKRLRKQYHINDEDFLIVTGGKIDLKKKIHILMQAVQNLNDVKLLVFGNILDDVKKEFDSLIKSSKNIKYIGWINSNEVYNYFFAADLVVFPGQHSVLWEQACASKVPCLFEKWEGMEHVNNGGNSMFITPITKESLEEKIKSLIFTYEYKKMKAYANSELTDIYLYSNIAKKSLECAKEK